MCAAAFCAPRPVIDLSDGALRDATQRTLETADGDVGSTSPYGIDCEDGVVGAVDANGSVTGVLPGHWAGSF